MRKLLDKARQSHANRWEDWCEDIGAAGTTLAALCCLGIPSVVSLVSAAGIGFLTHSQLRIPVLSIFLVLSFAGLALGWLHHGKPWPLLLAAVCGFGIFSSAILPMHPMIGFSSIGGFIAATILNIWYEHCNADSHQFSPTAAREWRRTKRHSREIK